MNVSTETLVDMLCAILREEAGLTASDVVNVEQIQRELYRRRNTPLWGSRAVN